MENSGKMRNLARFALLGAALIWGSSFIMVKNTIEVIPTHWLLFFRFTIGSVVLSLVMFKRLKKLNRDTVKHGAILGCILFAFYSIQTLGVSIPVLGAQATTAGKSAFLTGLYCVLTPFIIWIVYKKRPDLFNILAALLCVVGIGFVVLGGDVSGILLGDVFTLINSIFTALYIVLASSYSQKRDVMLLTIVQFVTAAIISLVVALIFEPFPTGATPSSWASVVYLAVFCTAVALGFQNFGQKYAPPSTAALLLCLEAPFGALFAVLVGGGDEKLSVQLIIGFVLIFLSIIVSETQLQFIPAFRKKAKAEDAPE
ncbi:DMT family transporter [Clostridia bacterium OttesenSCG-928-O13]|nr:DMT family transporter [Clostridia bacterium OttesenSCG-928-O13]